MSEEVNIDEEDDKDSLSDDTFATLFLGSIINAM